LSGYAFQWTSRLASSHYGWFVGWAGLMAFVPGFTGLNLGLAPILSERLGLSLDKTSILIVVAVLILSQFLINLAGVKIAARINNVAAFTADLAEETKMARRRVPRSVVVSLLISIVIGFLILIGLTINISDLGATLAAPVPITHLLEDALGSGGALVFEWVAMIALFAGGLANTYRIHYHELTLRGSYHHTPAGHPRGPGPAGRRRLPVRRAAHPHLPPRAGGRAPGPGGRAGRARRPSAQGGHPPVTAAGTGPGS
jgi:hypothetical protein